MEQPTFDFLESAFRAAFKEFGANAPMTVTIQQTITRFYQQRGQTAIANARRELSAATGIKRQRTTDAEIVQKVKFQHPKAKPTAESTVQPPVGLPKQGPESIKEQANRPGRKPKTETQNVPVVGSEKPDSTNGSELPGNEPGSETDVQPIPAAELKALAGLRPTDVVEKYDDATIIATINKHFQDSSTDGLRPKQLAALLLELIKTL